MHNSTVTTLDTRIQHDILHMIRKSKVTYHSQNSSEISCKPLLYTFWISHFHIHLFKWHVKRTIICINQQNSTMTNLIQRYNMGTFICSQNQTSRDQKFDLIYSFSISQSQFLAHSISNGNQTWKIHHENFICQRTQKSYYIQRSSDIRCKHLLYTFWISQFLVKEHSPWPILIQKKSILNNLSESRRPPGGFTN